MFPLLQQILNVILPPRCLKCGSILREDDGLCPECFNQITFVSKPYCHRCGHPFESAPPLKELVCGECIKQPQSPFRFNRSALKYDDESKAMLLNFKFNDKTENAVVFAKWLKTAGTDLWQAGADVLVPIPLHYTRLIKRRYNQSGLLAHELGKITRLPVDYSCVIRHKKTRPQVEFSGHERVRNVKGAFSVKHPEHIKGKRIVLIDDVMTTGSTLKECAIVLLAAGAKSVDTLTVARVIK